LARAGLTKQTARHEKGRPLAGFGLAAAGDKATGGVDGCARADVRARAHVDVQCDMGSGAHGCASASGRWLGRLRRCAQQLQARGKPRTSYGEMAPGESGDQERRHLWHAHEACAPERPSRARALVRGGGTVARHATGKRGRKKEDRVGMRAWNDGSGTCKKASQPGVGENDLQKLCPHPAKLTVSARTQLRLTRGSPGGVGLTETLMPLELCEFCCAGVAYLSGAGLRRRRHGRLCFSTEGTGGCASAPKV
jgi:hypothetical protein